MAQKDTTSEAAELAFVMLSLHLQHCHAQQHHALHPSRSLPRAEHVGPGVQEA